jgi:glycosyltransferase involved in cell wall biosynthesis
MEARLDARALQGMRRGLLPDRSVAVVHEWFGATGGSENVFLAISDLLPHAEGFVLWRDRHARRGTRFRQSWLARTPLRHSKALALPVMPLTWRTLTRERFDVVISSSHAFAHTVRMGPPQETRYLSYVHSPARYLWSPGFDGRGSTGLLKAPRKVLQLADARLGRHVHSFAVNSREVQSRVKRFWGRDSLVIYPPVDVAYFSDVPARLGAQDRSYLLGVGRWIPYKNFDLIIEIAAAARMPLVIAGSGPAETALRRHAARVDVPVTFEHQPSQARLRELYWGAQALLFPVHEDFGIIPVEAMACGTPVVGLRRGGLLETVVDGETGYLLDSTDPRRYAVALGMLHRLDRVRLAAHAWTFATEEFNLRLASWIDSETP